MVFKEESTFEEALIKALVQKGWESNILQYPSEKDLLINWANILFENNRGIDRLNDFPLTDGEMQQIIEQIISLRTPLKLNGFINGRTISITRDNPNDEIHFGKEISLKIYDRAEIAAGSSRYQIAQQPLYNKKSKILNNRRGDITLLINGMPLIHIELKRSGVSVSQACQQIKKYSHEGVFTDLFSLVQIFVAMEPNETVYFANPGPEGKFNENYYFHWADFNNEPYHNWTDLSSTLLSIPMAHQLIGYYTVADASDGVLKVMRSYQYYAANAISDRVAKNHWDECNQLGGFIWHTTGSGKTMTSFKSAQLIANSQDADKVIFLMDRIELGTQSLKEYRAFADDNEDVQATENTNVLVSKLKSNSLIDTLIVTSIQKMSNIKNEENSFNDRDIEIMSSKRIVFIVDEAHRSTFGDMLVTIKNTFNNALFFGFTGTPIQNENQKRLSTTSSIFGNELHRYSIADGIRDKNVLGFDPYKILTYKDNDLRECVALMKAKTKSQEIAISDPSRSSIYYKYMDSSQVKMAGYTSNDGNYIKGIEDYLGTSQYKRKKHQNKVVEDILHNWTRLSHNGKFHAIFATSSINEAIIYYKLIKKENPELKITALFDPSIDNIDGQIYKEDGLVEILSDYNKLYNQDFSMATHNKFKRDIASRLAHKEPYLRIENAQDKQIDLLIVVDQMLTGFDSKWINTLYLDKLLEYENIIQAFSRTNRLFDEEKPFGTIRYYRKPHTMEQNIEKAVKLYSGDKPLELFAQKLDYHLQQMNEVYKKIEDLFKRAGVKNFEKLPDDLSERKEFSKLFSKFNAHLEASKIQGFNWSIEEYSFSEPNNFIIKVLFNEMNYLILAQRYKELFHEVEGKDDVPFDVEGYLIEIDTAVINADYLNTRFEKYLKVLNDEGIDDDKRQSILNELYSSFATLSQDDQKFANIFLHDVQSGNVKLDDSKSFRDYIVEYQFNSRNDKIHKLSQTFGLDEEKLRVIMESSVNISNLNDCGRFDSLKDSVDLSKAQEYFEKSENKKWPNGMVNVKVRNLLKDFIIKGGYELDYA
ncbi:MAG: type I restriction endonuclease subunit R [Spirochaetaceae bacterium]|nr:type I restriction endonuclease subunit R [Spirochaetaceae bacterium]